MDGWGHRQESAGNAVKLANTPVIDRLDGTAPKAFLLASGPAVGLPEGQVGNSEVGHMTIGAGRIITQDLTRIDMAVADGSIAELPALDAFAKRIKATSGTAHLLGLLSGGGVHSRDSHILTLANALTQKGVNVALHAFTDGRDTLPQIAAVELPRFIETLPKGAFIASVIGRYYAMDRDSRWERTEAAWNAIVHGKSAHSRGAHSGGDKNGKIKTAPNASDAIQAAYSAGLGDEFIPPTIIGDYHGIKPGDSVLMANFRSDRVRQLMAGFCEVECGFDKTACPILERPLGMVHFSDALAAHMDTLLPSKALPNTLGEVVAAAGLTQLRLAETEKYPHVTFFLNGGDEQCRDGERHTMIASPKVATYDLCPEMSADGVLQALLEAINTHSHDLIIVNFANPDMVGHTGILDAAIAAVETIDAAIGKVITALDTHGGVMLLTADHGNCEIMWDDAANCPHTAHSYNPVPVYLIGCGNKSLCDGTLADIAPSLLELLDIDCAAEMTGHSILKDNIT